MWVPGGQKHPDPKETRKPGEAHTCPRLAEDTRPPSPRRKLGPGRRVGEGNGNPLQCSCLENPRDGGALWASVYGVAQSRTRLKRLSRRDSEDSSSMWLEAAKARPPFCTCPRSPLRASLLISVLRLPKTQPSPDLRCSPPPPPHTPSVLPKPLAIQAGPLSTAPELQAALPLPSVLPSKVAVAGSPTPCASRGSLGPAWPEPDNSLLN